MAALTGAWVVTPAVFMGKKSAALKYERGIQTKRTVWVSKNFMQAYRQVWALMLEVLNVNKHHWNILTDVSQYCTAKVKAQRARKDAEVLALVTPEEATTNALPHVFGPHEFLEFVRKLNQKRTTFGLGCM